MYIQNPKYGHFFITRFKCRCNRFHEIKKIKILSINKKKDDKHIFNLLKPFRSLTLRPFGCNILTFDKFIIIYLCTISHTQRCIQTSFCLIFLPFLFQACLFITTFTVNRMRTYCFRADLLLSVNIDMLKYLLLRLFVTVREKHDIYFF